MEHWFFTNPRAHLKALYEVAFMTGCGLGAFACLPFIRNAHRALIDNTLPPLTLYDTVSRGQLYPFCFSMIGAILWLQGQEFKGKGIPGRPVVGLAVYGASALCIIMYALNPRFDQVLPHDLVVVSYWVVALFVAIRYFLVVVREMPVTDFQKALQDDSDDMTDRARARRGEA